MDSKNESAPEGAHGDLAGGRESTNSKSVLGGKSTTIQLFVKNWNAFQHYGKRNPPWIKLHRAILDDYAFCALPDTAKGHLMLLWLYASQNNGQIPHDAAFLERKLSITALDIDSLIGQGFLLVDASSSGTGSKGASK